MDSVGKKILIIEDDQFLREFYQDLFQTEGHTVDVAGDGEAGLTKAIAGGWDLILLDLMLPKKDGPEVLREIKLKNPPPQNGPIVILTSLGQEVVIKECLTMGAAGYFLKTALNPDQVLALVNKYLCLKT